MHVASYALPALVAIWVIYRRVKRTIGFQPLAVGRMSTRMLLLAVAAVLLALSGIVHPWVYVGMAAGLIVGLVLVYCAVRTTVFEQRNEKWFYRPNGWIGAVLLVLFFGRLLYRFARMYEAGPVSFSTGTPASPQTQGIFSTGDPITMGVLFVLVSYYIGYYVYLMRHQKHLEKSSASAPQNE